MKRRRALRRRYGHSGPPDPAGEYGSAQRMFKLWAAHLGLDYVSNSALPSGRIGADGSGVWTFYARPRAGGRASQHEVTNTTVRAFWARHGAS